MPRRTPPRDPHTGLFLSRGRRNPSEYYGNEMGDAAYRMNPGKPSKKQLAARARFAAMARARAGRHNPAEYLDARMNPAEYYGLFGDNQFDSIIRNNPSEYYGNEMGDAAYRMNPGKPSKKQLAARARFAAMARARAGRHNPAEYLDARMNPSHYFDARMNPMPGRDSKGRFRRRR